MNDLIETSSLRQHLGNFLGSVSGVCMTFVQPVEPRPSKDRVAVNVIVGIEERHLAYAADVVAILVARYFESLDLRYKFDIRPVRTEDFRRLYHLDDSWQSIYPGRK